MKIINNISPEITFNIALVIGRFNYEITQKLYDGAIQRLKELNFEDEQITAVWVPGAIEIPLVTQRLAYSENIEAVICLGCVIRGETTHYDYVCQQVSAGCQQVALESEMPIVFGVLTTEDEAQALERVGGTHGHKGRDAVDTAIEMVSILRQL